MIQKTRTFWSQRLNNIYDRANVFTGFGGRLIAIKRINGSQIESLGEFLSEEPFPINVSMVDLASCCHYRVKGNHALPNN